MQVMGSRLHFAKMTSAVSPVAHALAWCGPAFPTIPCPLESELCLTIRTWQRDSGASAWVVSMHTLES